MTRKQLLFIIIPVVVAIIIIAVFVFVSSRQSTNTVTNTNTNQSKSFLPVSGDSSKNDFTSVKDLGVDGQAKVDPASALDLFSIVIDERVTNATLAPTKNALITMQNGEFYSRDLVGKNPTQLSKQSYTTATAAVFAPNGLQAAVAVPNNGAVSWKLFDLEKKKEYVMSDKVVGRPTFSPDSNTVLYQQVSDAKKKSELYSAQSDGGSTKKIRDLPLGVVQLDWITGRQYSYYTSNSADTASALTLSSLDGKTGYTVLQNVFGLNTLWSPSGKQVVVSSLTPGTKNMQLAVVDSKGALIDNLHFASFVNKCVWTRSEAILYCAKPDRLFDKGAVPTEYLSGAFYTNDTIWRIDVANGTLSQIFVPGSLRSIVDVETMFFGDDEKILYMVNRRDRKLYALNLTKLTP